MVGFGFMDNSIMIYAGDWIDCNIGVKFGLSTLTAAACGQMVSDSCGAIFGNTIEAFFARLGLPYPNLTEAQRDLKVVRTTGTAGAAIGVFTGCLLGLCNLFVIDLRAANRMKRMEELKSIFSSVVDCALTVMGMRVCVIWLHSSCEAAWDQSGVSETNELWVVNSSEGATLHFGDKDIVPCEAPTPMTEAFRTKTKVEVRSGGPPFLFMPIKSTEDENSIIGVIGVRKMEGDHSRFSGTQEKLLAMLAEHASIFVNQLDEK
jgi:hypothetical protein